MRSTMKHLAARAALAFAIMLSPFAQVIAGSCSSEASGGDSLDTPEEQHAYHVNHCFNIGNRDGYRDRKEKKSRIPDKKCKDVEARQAQEIGYQLGLEGERSYRRDHRLSNWAKPRVGP